MTSKTLAIVTAILAGLQVIAGAANLGDLMSAKAAAWLALSVAAVQAGVAVYTGKVASTPADNPTPRDPTS